MGRSVRRRHPRVSVHTRGKRRPVRSSHPPQPSGPGQAGLSHPSSSQFPLRGVSPRTHHRPRRRRRRRRSVLTTTATHRSKRSQHTPPIHRDTGQGRICSTPPALLRCRLHHLHPLHSRRHSLHSRRLLLLLLHHRHHHHFLRAPSCPTRRRHRTKTTETQERRRYFESSPAAPMPFPRHTASPAPAYSPTTAVDCGPNRLRRRPPRLPPPPRGPTAHRRR